MGVADFKKRVLDLLKGTFAVNGYYGLPDLGTNAALVENIFGETYSGADLTAIKGWFASQTIEVLGEYSRKPSRLPVVFVYRLSDVEDDRSELGDRFGYENVTATDFDQKFGVRMKEEVELAIWAHTDPTMRDALYSAVKLMILRGRPFLENYSKNIDMVMWRGGRDGQGYMGDTDRTPFVIHTATARLVANTRSTWSNTVEIPDELNGTSEYNEWTSEG